MRGEWSVGRVDQARRGGRCARRREGSGVRGPERAAQLGSSRGRFGSLSCGLGFNLFAF